MNYKELCDFKTINESIELKKQKGNIQKEDDKEYVCNSKNENAKNIEQLLNNISKSLHNRGRKDKFKRVWTSFLGFWSDKAGQYSANLNKALQEVREYVKEILDGNPRFQIDFESRDAVIEDYLDYNRIFPRYITYYKKDGANDEKDGTKSFKIWASDIQDFFDNYSNNRKSVISAIKSLKGNLEEKKAIKDDIKNTRRAIEILQDCLDRGIWIAAAALLSNIEKKKEDMVAVINESYLPLARTYQVLDGIGEEADSLQKAIKDADIPFFSKELDAVNKHCKDKGVKLKVAIETLTLKPKNDKTDQEVEDLEILENLKQKISASKAAYDLRSAKCNSVSTGDNIKEIAEYGDNAKYDPSEKNAVVRMANKEIKKKQSKIRLGVFISIVIFFLVVAIFSAFKPGIKYAIGREIVAEVDGCEYTYRKFDDTGVEIVAAKMPEGISEYAVIPEIDGHKVVAISEGVFADYTDFESVYIGKDIVQVGSNAFARKDNARITIYCEAQAKPDAWAKDWANDNVVVWGWTDSQQNIEITWGNLRFAIDKGKKQAAILGLSSEAKGDEVDEIEIPSNVTYESEEYTVVRVADEAFKDAIYISKITLPASVTNIGFGAFEGCSSLTDIAIPFVGATVSGEKVSEEINTMNFGYIFGADGTAKNAEYVPATLESVTIYGGIIAANAFGGCSNLQNIILGNSVKSIAHGAFNGEMSIKSLTLPFVGESYDKVTFIGYIFGETDYEDNNKALPCSLQTVTVTDNCNIADYAFYGCENIVTVNIASNGETDGGIGKSAFAKCIGLQTVTIKNGKFIDDSAFANCTSLIKVTVPDEIESFGNDVLQGCANIEYNNSNGIKYLDGNREYYRVLIDATNVEKSVVVTNVNTRIIAQNAFNGCLIEEIIITEDVVMIGDSAFANCVNIRHLTIPDNVKKIGEGALNGCSNLLSLTLPFVGAEAGVTSTYAYQYPFGYIFGKSLYEGGVATKQYYRDSNIQSAVFGGGIKFTKSAIYYIPESLCYVTITSGNILEGAFYNCNNITNLTIPNTIQDIGNYAFYNCTALKKIEIPDNVTDIGNCAFYGCNSLSSITIPKGVTRAGKKLFYNCINLINIIFEEGCQLSNIGEGTFYECSKLKSITIPNRVTIIGRDAFYNCYSMTSIFISDSVASIGWFAFYNCSAEIIWGENPTITQIGEYAFSGYKGTSINIPSSVTSIGDYAFYGCNSLTSLTIPDSVITISDNAFKGCSSLDTVNFDATSRLTELGAGVFADCQALQNITIPNAVTSIKNDSFNNCNNLTSIVIPKAVIEIGDNAFKNCSKLSSATFSEGSSLETIGQSAFEGCGALSVIALPDKISSIGTRAFANCSMVTDLIIPANVTFVGDAAFEGCNAITNITMPTIAIEYISKDNLQTVVLNGGEEIPAFALAGCSKLSSVMILNSVKYIREGVLGLCENLESIELPKSIVSIGKYFLQNCRKLSSIKIEEGNQVYHSNGNCIIETFSKTLIVGCGTSVIPNDGSVIKIGESAFNSCMNLKNIVLPDSITSIGSWAFGGSTSLDSIIFSKSLEIIEDHAFYGCKSLINIEIPDSVKTIGNNAFGFCIDMTMLTFVGNSQIEVIGDNAFENCTSLSNILIPTSVISIGGNAFKGCNELTIYCKLESQPNGWTQNWNSSGCPVVWGNLVTTNEEYDYEIYAGAITLTNYKGSAEEIIIPSEIDGYAVVGFGEIFRNNDAIISIIISENILSIDDYAFYDCNSLTSVKFKENCRLESINSYAFQECNLLNDINIPNSVVYIGDGAFDHCFSLLRIMIPNSVTAVGDAVFYGCSSLLDVIFEENCHLTNITTMMFYNCHSLTSITIPDSVISIGQNAFACGNNSSLTSITIPDSVINIEYGAFENCELLESIIIPASVTNFITSALGAFNGCRALTIYCEAASEPSGWGTGWNSNRTVVWGYNNITENVDFDYVVHEDRVYLTKYKNNATQVIIPSTVDNKKVVGFGDIFAENTKVISIFIPDSVKYIATGAFRRCVSLESIAFGVGSQLKSIGISAFSGCTSLTSIVIPDSVTSIGDWAFSDCTGLTSIVIPDSVTSIGNYSFYYCTSLTNIVIPDSVKRIGYEAFYNCTSLIDITFENTQSWQVAWDDDFLNYTKISSSDLADASIAATYLKDTYRNYYWRRVE